MPDQPAGPPATEVILLTVTAERADFYRRSLACIQPTNAHPLPGERILDLALTSIARQAAIRAWRKRRARSPIEPRSPADEALPAEESGR